MSISVIIPVFNGEKTIEETINSILNQTFKKLEIIIINDGSTDNTLEIIKKKNRFSNPNLFLSKYWFISKSQSRNFSISI